LCGVTCSLTTNRIKFKAEQQKWGMLHPLE
jgi:hypothetical protein